MTRAPYERPRREPAFNVPGVVLASCLVLLAIHAVRQFVSVETDNTLVATFAFLPARVTYALDFDRAALQAAYRAATQNNPMMEAQIRFLLGEGHLRPWTVLTYAFLHGSWTHVGFNCVWLLAFGSPVARRFRSLRFLLLLAIAAIAGAMVEYAFDPTGFQIVIGASAGIAGAMGAATRFIFRPSDEMQRVFDRRRLETAYRDRALSLRETLTTKAALVFVIIWFVTNLAFGFYPALSGINEGPIAWPAHIGGFVAGLLLFPLFDPRRPAAPEQPLDGEPDVEPSATLPNEDPGPAPGEG